MRDIVNAAIGGQRFAMQTLGVFGARGAAPFGDRDLRDRVAGRRVALPRVRDSRSARRDASRVDGDRTAVRASAGDGRDSAPGIVAALLLTRVLGALLQGVSSTDPLTFIAVVAVTGLVAIVASLGPARRAGRIDPNIALRAAERAD